MRMLPPAVPPSTLHGERRVFSALKDLDEPGGTALHSLFLPEHDYKVVSEADFVLVLDDIVMVVEVKAAGVSCRSGVWEYTDREGHHRRETEGPFRQADSARYALEKRIQHFLGVQWTRDVPFGWVVITPDVDLPASFAWADEVYIGRAAFTRPGGLDQSLRTARKYWTAKQPGRNSLGAQRREQLVGKLRPDFEVVPPLAVRTEELEAAFVRLTEEQFSRLDLIAENDRVLCRGGAGTGKTFLAAEVARREYGAGRRTALVCRAPVLAAVLAKRLSADAVPVMTPEQLQASPPGSWDHIVVDEAQDLMTFDFLDVVDRSLAGGLADGRWTFFYDPNGQSRLHDVYDPAAEQLLVSHGAVRAGLTRNCRNTREIAFHTRAHTGADIGVASAGSGPEVKFPSVHDDDSEVQLLEAHLRDLRDQEVPVGTVTLLSAQGDWDTTVAKRLKAHRKGRMVRLKPSNADAWPMRQLTWATVLDFKGLENAFICVIDLHDLTDPRALDTLYVAMTRARAGLWIAVRPEVAPRLTELFTTHAHTAASALKEASR